MLATIVSLGAELLQHLLRGDVLSRACLLRLLYELHLTEEDIAHLFRARDIETFAGFLIDFLLQVGHTLCEQLGCLLERCCVEADSRHLHVGEYRHEWHLHLPEELVGIGLFEFWLQDVLKFQCYVGIFRRILIDILRLQVAHRLLVSSFLTYQFLDMDGLVVEKSLGHIVHVVM